MIIVSVVGFMLLTVVAAALAVTVSARFYWLAAVASWGLSFLWSWTLGLYTLVFTFIFLALAVRHLFGWVESAYGDVAAAGIGIACWAVAVATLDDYWLFYPLAVLGEMLFS